MKMYLSGEVVPSTARPSIASTVTSFCRIQTDRIGQYGVGGMVEGRIGDSIGGMVGVGWWVWLGVG